MASVTHTAMSAAMPGALLTAWLVDAAFGEPPVALHPVAWLGRVLAPIGPALRDRPPPLAFAGGASAWLVAAAVVALLAWCVERGLASLPAVVAPLLLGLLLKPCFAWRMLRDEVRSVEAALADSLEAGRGRVARLCSRDTSAMDEDAVREVAIETLAENLNDSLVAPLFWFVVAGLPGAAVYRFANTADAMWGYRGRDEWFGKWAARADDVLSWVPARIAAGLLVVQGDRAMAGRLREEAARTPSPNGGWPMAAMALGLGVRLRKPGVYVLNGNAPSPRPNDVTRALVIAQRAAWSAVGATLAACLARAAWT